MDPVPKGNCELFTARVAVAVPAEPVNVAEPSEVPLMEKETDPVGVRPFVEVAVATRYTTWLGATVRRLLNKVTLVVALGGAVLPPLHPVISLYASTDPRPVV